MLRRCPRALADRNGFLAHGGMSQITAVAFRIIRPITFPERYGRSVCSVTQAQPTDGQALGTPEVAESRFRLASVTVPALGALGLALIAAWVLLTSLTRDLQISRDGAAVAAGLVCGLVGMLVARRQARNPEGWLLLGVAVGVFVVLDSGLYAVLGYRVHHGRLPLGEVAVIGKGSIGEPLIFCFALVILLFPDGRLTRGWTWVLWVYLVLSIGVAVGFGPKTNQPPGTSRTRLAA